jgi:Tfp pilus assembly protein PilE
MSTGVLAAIIIAVVLFGGVVVVGVVAAIAIPSLLAARSAANEAGAQANLRELGAAEATYYAAHGRFGTIDELVAASALEPGWSEGAVRNGYRFSVVEVGEETFEFKAEPDPPTNGKRSFNLTEDFVVRAKDGAVAPTGTSGKAVAGG